ncbi:MAG: hypothetical protein WA715_29220 [Candidatus Acidiferrum sp.]
MKLERIDPPAAYVAEQLVWVAERDGRRLTSADLISRQGEADEAAAQTGPADATKARPDKHILSHAERAAGSTWRFCHTTGQPS